MVHSAIGQDDLQEMVHFVDDPEAGAKGVIVLHSTALGPAMGGCRIWPYQNDSARLKDAMRLARGMSYKNALAGLPFGGGKAVLQRPEGDFDRAKLFRAFGSAVAALDGRYITAEDVGTSVSDMKSVAEATSFVAGLPSPHGRAGGDPSPWTALGVFRSMTAASRHLWGRDLRGMRIAVQGVGSVGFGLCAMLAEAGARLLIADVDAEQAERAARKFGAEIAAGDALLTAPADILAPCALGGVLNQETIAALGAPLICGAANNQLEREEDGDLLRARGIVYAPDYVVNAGGIINVAAEYLHESEQLVGARIDKIAHRLLAILEQAERDGAPTNAVADAMARDVIRGSQSVAA